jgi:hypothetical protein
MIAGMVCALLQERLHIPQLVVRRHVSDVAACLQGVSDHLILALSHVPAFEHLDRPMLQKLLDAMSAAKYEMA